MTISNITGAWNQSKKALFGGAIRLWVPDGFIDASDLRQISDHQEVFVDSNSDQSIIVEILELPEDSEHDNFAKFHFEELGVENDASGDDLTIYTIEALNPALSLPGVQTRTMPNMSPEQQYSYQHRITAQILIGSQNVSKFHGQASPERHRIDIYLLCIRIPFLKTDILLTLNHPSELDDSMFTQQLSNQDSSETQSARAGAARERGEAFSTLEVNARPDNQEPFRMSDSPTAYFRFSYFQQVIGNQNASSRAHAMFWRTIESFEIVDWSLFGESFPTSAIGTDIINH